MGIWKILKLEKKNGKDMNQNFKLHTIKSSNYSDEISLLGTSRMVSFSMNTRARYSQYEITKQENKSKIEYFS